MKKNIFVASLMLMGFAFLSPADTVYADPDSFVPVSLETVEGSLSQVDEEQRRITVHWMYDQVMMKYQDITMEVPPSAAITKNEETIELRDLENGDHATVRYDPNAIPIPRAMSISVVE